MGPLPPDDEGNTYLAVGIDVFTKWVEARPLKSKHAFRTSDWLYTDIVARWGRPSGLRLDNGSEWGAEFTALCEDLGIVMAWITVGNSRANG
jgi:hypothetical protein